MGRVRKRFETVVSALSADIYRYAFWLCRDRDVAEELAGETFTHAWRFLGELGDEREARSWLMCTARREHARRFECRPCEPGEAELDELRGDALAERPQILDVGRVRRALDALPQRYREPLVLQALGGYTSIEIAQILDLSPPVVDTRLFRARQRLRRMVAQDEHAGRGRMHAS